MKEQNNEISSSAKKLGSLGGKATFALHGAQHFSNMGKKSKRPKNAPRAR